MQSIYPSYYREFRCIAGACPDSCCHEWEVEVDPVTAKVYDAMEGALGDELRRHLYRDGEGIYLRNSGDRCPMWRQDGLCRIQAEHGHEALCQVCRQFPRLRHDYGDFEELGLEMSCPEAARLILAGADGIQWAEELPGEGEPGYDSLDMEILLQTRETARQILRNPDIPVQEALAVLLVYGYAAQAMLDAGEIGDFSPENALQTARELAQPGDLAALVGFYQGLEILTERWRNLLNQWGSEREWSTGDRAFARYLIDRYWLQAVSDFDLVSRVKFAVVSCVMVHGLGGDILHTAQLYSKEIENDAQNVDAILDGAYTEPAMTDRNLLGLLLK